CLVALVQGLLGKRTALTAWNLDVIFARGKPLPLPLGVMPHGYPHLTTVRTSIHALYRHLSRARIGEFARSIPRGVADLDAGEGPVLAVQRIARAITEHLGLPAGKILVTFESSLKTPGQVELTAQDVYFVSLATRYRQERRDIAAILAHEITHVFLFRAGLR